MLAYILTGRLLYRLVHDPALFGLCLNSLNCCGKPEGHSKKEINNSLPYRFWVGLLGVRTKTTTGTSLKSSVLKQLLGLLCL